MKVPDGNDAVTQEAKRLIRSFMEPSQRGRATHDLAALGDAAVRAVASVLDGTARNEFGVPYHVFGEALRCALITAKSLGSAAAPLELAIAAELANESPIIRCEAAAALGALPSLSHTTIGRLAEMLDDELEPAAEAAVTILRLKLTEHLDVRDAVARSPKAKHTLARMHTFMENRGSGR